MQARGAVYHHSQMVFRNGFIGKKYLVLLNTPGKNEPYLFLKTTSQKKNKPSIPGCIIEHNIFFIPAGKTIFKLDTWVQLHERYEYTPQEIDSNRDITVVEGSLDAKMIDDIVKCLLKAQKDDLPPIHKELLCPPLQDSLLKLQEKFKNR